MLAKDIEDNKAIGKFGCETILKNVEGDGQIRVLTHCNTGSLATAGYGTALGVIRSLHEAKRLGQKFYYIIFICLSMIIYMITTSGYLFYNQCINKEIRFQFF